jgi:FixJ family two-component response regulator
VVTGVADVPTAVKLMENGAVTVLEKPYDHAGLLRAVERAWSISQERWSRLQTEQSIGRRLASLTDEERAVMHAMLADEPNKSIAHKLDVGMRTIDRRRRAVLAKMSVSSVPELARLLTLAHPETLPPKNHFDRVVTTGIRELEESTNEVVSFASPTPAPDTTPPESRGF